MPHISILSMAVSSALCDSLPEPTWRYGQFPTGALFQSVTCMELLSRTASPFASSASPVGRVCALKAACRTVEKLPKPEHSGRATFLSEWGTVVEVEQAEAPGPLVEIKIFGREPGRSVRKAAVVREVQKVTEGHWSIQAEFILPLGSEDVTALLR